MVKLKKDTPVPPLAYECGGCWGPDRHWPAEELIWWWGICYESDGEYLRVVEPKATPGWYCLDCIEAKSWEAPPPDDLGPTLAEFLVD